MATETIADKAVEPNLPGIALAAHRVYFIWISRYQGRRPRAAILSSVAGPCWPRRQQAPGRLPPTVHDALQAPRASAAASL
jgi:hypothetical protein